jgi:hypothetical protein
MGNPNPDHLTAVAVEILVSLLTFTLLGFQVGCWVVVGFVTWRLANVGRNLI